MWYKKFSALNLVNSKPKSYDEIIAESCAELSVTNRLRLNCDYDPAPSKINAITKKVLKAIEEKYGDFHLMRRNSPNEELEPLIMPIVDEVMPRKG